MTLTVYARVQTLTWAACMFYSISFSFALAFLSVEPDLKDDLVTIGYDRFLFSLSRANYLHWFEHIQQFYSHFKGFDTQSRNSF